MANTSVLTATGRSMVVGRLEGSTPTQAEFKNVGLDLNPSSLTAANTDIAPYSMASEAIVAGTSSTVTTTTTNDTYQVAGTVSITASSETIGGSWLSDSTTKPPTTTVAGGAGVIGSSSSTSLTVASASGFPGSGNYYIQIRTEVMEVTGGQGTTTWTVVRGVNGSTAISTIAASDPIVAGNIPGNSAITGGNTAIHSSWPTGLALVSGDSLAITQQLKFT